MKKFSIAVLAILSVSLVLGFIILFEGSTTNLSVWWKEKFRNSDWVFSSPYKDRRIDSDLLHFESANKIEFIDRHLFWRGSGAIAIPSLTEENQLHEVVVHNGGKGYSDQVIARVTGVMADEFELGPVVVENGVIKKVGIVKADAAWSRIPLAFCNDEKFPFSGTTEKKYPGGQVITETKYLSGVLHGKVRKFNEIGIPLFEKDYLHGEKEGTHIYWYPKPLDPEGYKPKETDTEPTLWLTLRKKAKVKFGRDSDVNEANSWVVTQYRLEGGKFQVRLLEHWKKNLKHGLFEGYDKNYYQTFESEFAHGHRIKHKTFDKNK